MLRASLSTRKRRFAPRQQNVDRSSTTTTKRHSLLKGSSFLLELRFVALRAVPTIARRSSQLSVCSTRTIFEVNSVVPTMKAFESEVAMGTISASMITSSSSASAKSGLPRTRCCESGSVREITRRVVGRVAKLFEKLSAKKRREARTTIKSCI